MSGAVHVPVLLDEVLEYLSPRPGATIADGTLGAGGHSAAVLEKILPGGLLIGMDRDSAAVDRGRRIFASHGQNVRLVHDNYDNLRTILESLDAGRLDGVLLDLGISSDQLLRSGRGFSFDADEELDMRMDPQEDTPTAGDIVNSASETELADILFTLGEERASRRIARRIVAARRRGPIRTSRELAAIVAAAMGGRRGRIHPATRSFQALRIKVNNEIGHLEHFLSEFYDCLAPGGRAVVISFHSLEDRLVKRRFRELAAGSGARVLTKKVVRPTDEEVERNPMARSAKLRALEKGAP